MLTDMEKGIADGACRLELFKQAPFEQEYYDGIANGDVRQIAIDHAEEAHEDTWETEMNQEEYIEGFMKGWEYVR